MGTVINFKPDQSSTTEPPRTYRFVVESLPDYKLMKNEAKQIARNKVSAKANLKDVIADETIENRKEIIDQMMATVKDLNNQYIARVVACADYQTRRRNLFVATCATALTIAAGTLILAKR